jgi:hypothetical protein
MLMRLSQLSGDLTDWFSHALRGELAIDPETGARLTHSNGRGKYGLNKYYLYKWVDLYHKVGHEIRAYSDGNAIEAAREFLARGKWRGKPYRDWDAEVPSEDVPLLEKL